MQLEPDSHQHMKLSRCLDPCFVAINKKKINNATSNTTVHKERMILFGCFLVGKGGDVQWCSSRDPVLNARGWVRVPVSSCNEFFCIASQSGVKLGYDIFSPTHSLWVDIAPEIHNRIINLIKHFPQFVYAFSRIYMLHSI